MSYKNTQPFLVRIYGHSCLNAIILSLLCACSGTENSNVPATPLPKPEQEIAMHPSEAITYTLDVPGYGSLVTKEEPYFFSRVIFGSTESSPNGFTASFSNYSEKNVWGSEFTQVKPGQWWPVGRHFLHVLGGATPTSGVAIGRVEPIPRLESTNQDLTLANAGPDPIVMVPNMRVFLDSPNFENKNLNSSPKYSQLQLESLTPERAIFTAYLNDSPKPLATLTAKAGDVLGAGVQFGWKVVALHPAQGDLPAYAELRVDLSAEQKASP
jgi:hypothetical protein